MRTSVLAAATMLLAILSASAQTPTKDIERIFGARWEDSARALIATGIDPNATMRSPFPIGLAGAPRPKADPLLTVAAQKNWVEVVRLLLAKGANPNATNEAGGTPLMAAGTRTYQDVSPGITPTVSNVLAAEDSPVVDALIAAGAKVDATDKYLWTPLHFAAALGPQGKVDKLIAAKAPLNAQDDQGRTPLMLAVLNQRVAAVRALLRNGADQTIPAKNKKTPLLSVQRHPYLNALHRARW